MDITANTIKFKEMVKLIHPDCNPAIKDPSLKMTEVVKFKNDPDYLYTLGIKWGIIKDFDINWYFNKFVTFVYNTKVLEGVVVTISEASENWVIENKTLEIVVKSGDGTLLKLTTVKNFIKKEIKILRDATSDEIVEYNIIKNMCINKKKSKPVVKKEMPKPPVVNTTDNDTHIIELRPHTGYGRQVSAYIRTRKLRFRIIRTTGKRVYYYDDIQNRIRYAQFKNAENARNV